MANISVLGNIAQQREAAKRDLSVEFPVPTWELDGRKQLLWSFKVVKKKILDDWVDTRRSLETDIDLLTEAHNGFFFYEPTKTQPGLRLWEDRDGKDRSDYVRVEDADTGEIVGLDLAFAEAIGFVPDETSKAAPSTQLALHLVKDNEAALSSMCGRMVAWQSNTDLDVTKLMMGES